MGEQTSFGIGGIQVNIEYDPANTTDFIAHGKAHIVATAKARESYQKKCPESKVFLAPSDWKSFYLSDAINKALAKLTPNEQETIRIYWQNVHNAQLGDLWNVQGGNPFVGAAKPRHNDNPRAKKSYFRPLTPDGQKQKRVIETAEALAERVTGVYDVKYWQSLKDSFEAQLWFNPIIAASIQRKAIHTLFQQNKPGGKDGFKPQPGTYLWNNMDPRRWNTVTEELDKDEKYTWNFIEKTKFTEYQKQ